MKYEDAKKLLQWADAWHAPTYPSDLADSLSCERTKYSVIPKRFLPALTAFRHQTQGARLRMAERYFDGEGR